MPVLKHQLDSLEGLDQAFHGVYEKNADGKYYLQVQGMVAKTVVDEFRTNNISLTNKLKEYEGFDPSDYKRLKDLEKQFTGKEPDEAAIEKKLQERVATMKKEHETQLTALNESNKTMKSQLEVLVIDNAVRAAATKVGVRPEAVDDVLLRAKTVFKFEKGMAVPYDAKGNVIYGKTGTEHMTPEEWAGSLKTTASHLFPQSVGAGATGPGSRGSQDTSKMSATQKIAAGLGNQ